MKQPITTIPTILASLVSADRLGSFMQTDLALGERLKVAEAEASKQAKSAEEAWQKSRKETDSLLAKVHSEMAALNSDLAKSSEKQKQDLALLETSRQQESEALNDTEKKLKDLQAHSQVTAPVITSFMEDGETDYLAPLRKAAEAAKVFAEKIRSQSSPQSLLQQGSGTEDFQAKAEHSLLQAQQALKKLDVDLAAQKEDLIRDEAKAKEDEANLRAASHVSFLQTDEKEDPLSPEALNAWHDKFEKTLLKARETVGIKTPLTSSFAQLDTQTESKLQEDERNVARLQQEYETKMESLKEENTKMMTQAHVEIEKARAMKAKLASDMAGSFVQTGTRAKYDLEKEHAKIAALQKKWEKSAEAFGSSQPKIAELREMINAESEKEDKSNSAIAAMQSTLEADVEDMKAAMRPVSFIQIDGDEKHQSSQDLMQHVRDLLSKLHRVGSEMMPRTIEEIPLAF